MYIARCSEDVTAPAYLARSAAAGYSLFSPSLSMIHADISYKLCERLLYWMKICKIPVSRVRFQCSVIGNFQIGKINAEAKILQLGKFAPREIYLLYGLLCLVS